MNSEIFEGNVTNLNIRLIALIVGPAATIDDVIVTSERGKYIIIWS